MFFTVEKIDKQLQELRLAVYRETISIRHWKFSQGNHDGAQSPGFDDRNWADFALGDPWGGYDVVAWFRATVPIPPQLRRQKLALLMRVGPKDSGNSTAESLLYINGQPLQAIDTYHPEAWLPPEITQNDEMHIALRAWSGVLDVPPHRHFRVADLLWVDEPTERFFYLASTLSSAIKELDPNDLRRVELERIADGAVRQIVFNKHDPEVFYGSVATAECWLQAQIKQ
jgi:alpha-mannosidase